MASGHDLSAASARECFVSELLRADLPEVTTWHASRPKHEQRRFLRTLSSLHAAQSPERLEVVGVCAAPDAPKGQRPSPAGAAKRNSFLDWLDGHSSESTSVGSRESSLATPSLSETDLSSSVCSFPGTTNQAAFRKHKRAAAANRPPKRRPDFYSGSGVRDSLSPENWQLDPTTSYQKHFGIPKPAMEDATVLANKCTGVFKAGQQSSMQRYAHASDAAQRREFASAVRSLESLRTAQRKQSRSHLDFDRKENERLWKPPLQRPVVDAARAQRSQVPLGVVCQRETPTLPTPTPAADKIAEDVPQSPLVSELGSLPLTALSYAESVDATSLPASSRRPESAKGSLQTSKKASGGSSARSSKASRPSRPLSAALARPAHSSSSQGSGPDIGRRVASQEKENHPELVTPDPDLGSEHPGPKDELAKRFETIFRPIRTNVKRVGCLAWME